MSKEFINFLASLSPEGETALFVKQKPILVDGQQQFHKDGAVKCTWPAYLPERYTGKGAWYVNTASFILDRFKNGKPSASRDCCEYVLFLILDDVGTKSKTPPLAPTWVMETSPGNYQWGYAFNEQPSKADFAAAIKAIAEAGYTDKGAINAVRNVRLPGSINLKPGRDSFASRLVEFHPDRGFSLEDICTTLGVVPDAADTSTWLPITLQDDGNDDVMAWLASQGLVIESANSSGWTGVVCPNHAEHSDGNPMGRYHPVNRSYCCLHAHCEEWNSEKFLAWVERQGGPSHQQGLRDDLLAITMTRVYDTIEKGDMFSESSDAEAVIAEVERKQLARLTKGELHKHFAYVETDDSYFDMSFRREYKRRTFDAVYRHLDTRSQFGKSPRITASVWFDEFREEYNGRVLAGITYSPGETVQCAREGMVFGNKWVDGRPAGVAGDVTRWLDLVKHVIPEEFEREHLLNVLAYKRQHPNVKINHAILLIGKPGIGKDSIYAPFLYSIGGRAQRNIHIAKGEEFTSQFTYGLENEVLVLNELRQPEGKDRRAMENLLKPIIAAPPDYLTVNRKGMHPYDAVNRILVLSGSNYDVPISLPSDDRRWFVVKSAAAPLAEDDAARLWAWYLNGGFEAVAAWLQARDVSAFNPGARPPMTEAKAVMIEHGMSSAEAFLVEMIRNQEGEFRAGVIGGPFHKLLDRLQGSAPSGVKLHQQSLLHALNEAGWIDAGRIYSKEYVTKKHVFHAPSCAGMTKSELRRVVEPPAEPKLVAVKVGNAA